MRTALFWPWVLRTMYTYKNSRCLDFYLSVADPGFDMASTLSTGEGRGKNIIESAEGCSKSHFQRVLAIFLSKLCIKNNRERRKK